MASNRDPRKSYRTNRRARRVTSSSDRSKRSGKSTVPKPTSSSTRSKTKGAASSKVTSSKDRVKKSPVKGPARGAQGPRTAPQQGPSQNVSGLIGSRKPARTTPPTSKTPKTPGRFIDKPQVQNNIRALQNSPLKYVRGLGKVGVVLTLAEAAKAGLTKSASDNRKNKAASSIGKYNTKDSDSTVRSRKKVGPKKVGPKKVGPKKVGTVAQSFDAAFAKARKAGQKTFTFQGKLYNTKLK